MNMSEYTKYMTQLFIQNKWTNISSKNSLKQLINFGNDIDEKYLEMIYDLTSHFIKIPWNDYENRLFESFNQIDVNNTFFTSTSNIYILPILKDKDKDKCKSTQTLVYACADEEIEFHPFFQKFNVLRKSEKETIEAILSDKNYRLLFIDDFIGTGETSTKYLEEFNTKIKIDKSKIFFLFLSGMEEGINKLIHNGYPVYCGLVQKKGISDILEQEKRQKYENLMKQLEKEYKIKKKYNFGYGRSESLIKMIRTPNNTFPIYWDKTKNPNAPFERK